jgi:hypothetical protein
MRIRKLVVSPQLIVSVCKRSMRFVAATHPLPDDARAVGTEWDASKRAVVVLVSSDQWADGDPETLDSPVFSTRGPVI